MGKLDKLSADKDLLEKKDLFIKNVSSEMHYALDHSSNALNFDWIDEIESACPFVDIIVRNPKLTLIKEEQVTTIERAKKITVDSVKDLAKHSNYITDVEKETGDVRPSKILDIRSEETYNIYENRFLYTMIYDLNRFVLEKEDLLKNFTLGDDKQLEYVASSKNGLEKLNIELKITSTSDDEQELDKKLNSYLEEQRKRIKKIKEFINSWLKSALIKELDKLHITMVKPPVKPTNIILKNPNFQLSVQLWEYIRNYDLNNKDNSKKGMETAGNEILKGYLDNSFLIDYFVLDSVSKKKKEEKEKICKYSILLLTEQINRTMALLLENGYKVTEEELLKMVAKQIKFESNNRLAGVDDIKKKFKSEISDYLERAQNSL